MWSPVTHSSSMYGPVPLGFVTIELVGGMCLVSQSQSLMSNEANAIFDEERDVRAHRSNSTVFASGAAIWLEVAGVRVLCVRIRRFASLARRLAVSGYDRAASTRAPGCCAAGVADARGGR